MIRSLFRKAYQPLNRILISGEALHHNLKHFRSLSPEQKISPVLKSNAYGHGLVKIAKLLDKEKCPYFIVDSLYEAYELKKAGIKTEILILGYQNPENLRRKMPFVFTAYDLESLRTLIGKKLPFHLEIDTGMRRMGLAPTELLGALPLIKQHPLLFQGVFSHLSTADSPDMNRLQAQGSLFQELVRLIHSQGLRPKWIHLGNSAGLTKIQIPEVNMARVGLGLYGINPYTPEDPYFSKLVALKPVLSLESTLIAKRILEPGESISYGAQFTTEHFTTLGIIPFGYYEGLPISLSNKGSLYCNGAPAPIIGRINMNHSFIELYGSPPVGAPVEVYSSDPSKDNSVAKLAQRAGTIPYELLVRLSPTIRRIVV